MHVNMRIRLDQKTKILEFGSVHLKVSYLMPNGEDVVEKSPFFDPAVLQ